MKTLALSASLAAMMAAPALANTAIGLAGDRTLVMIDLDSGQVTGMQDVDYDGRLLGIDYRNATGGLIGVTENFEVVSIDPMTGTWDLIVEMSAGMEIAEGAPVIVDINPVPDALRFMSGTTNHRINLTTGEAMVDGDLHFGDDTDGTPMIAGTAYTNNVGTPESTAMFNIDMERGALLRQTAPNDGTNEMVGELGVMLEAPIAFDISTDAESMNTGWLYANGQIHTVSLEDASVTNSWDIAGLDVVLRDMTVMGAME
ncbi:MAG: DUF4394 domain-containing protein [Natronohydrobacter sp.]|nr:DUF4394 domain-containing protein [Natronohydrobacter sp.]